MRDDPLTIEDLGVKDGTHWLKLSGPLTLSTLFEFQALVRAHHPNCLALDCTGVPYIDSAGVGVLVGAGVRHQNLGRKLVLVGVNSRIRGTLQVTQVESFFEYGEGLAGGAAS
jgi:anti-sigma B factor antagonist